MTFSLKIVTPERVIFEDVVQKAQIPTVMGQITVLPHHDRLFALLSVGKIELTQKHQKIWMVCNGGFIQVKHNQVTILADQAYTSQEISSEDIHEKAKDSTQLLAFIKSINASV